MSIQSSYDQSQQIFISLARRNNNNILPAGPGEKVCDIIYAVTLDQKTTYGRPELTLTPEKSYSFVIDCKGFPFYITTHDRGGGAKRIINGNSESLIDAIRIEPPNAPGQENTGVENGILIWTPERLHEDMTLYYQCNTELDMGGKITIKSV